MDATLESLESSTDLTHVRMSSQQNWMVGEEEAPEFLRLKNEGNFLFRENKYEEALERYTEASNHSKGDDQLTALLHNQGATFEQMIEFEKALEVYNAAIAKKPEYLKVLKRRCKLLSSMGKHKEAMEDLVEISFQQVKRKNQHDTYCTALFRDVLAAYIHFETTRIFTERGPITPPKYIIEGYLRPFFADPVTKIWKGTEKTPVDDLIAEGKAENLTGYLAAVRDLKLKKYDTIIKHCSDEILQPSSEETLLNAYYLRGTMGLIWGMTPETVLDFNKVIDSPLSTNEVKSSAHLKLALRFTIRKDSEINNLAEEFGKSEDLWPGNPDVYFHGGVALIDRADPFTALEMIENGIKLCGENASILMQTLYWSVKFSITNDEFERNEAFGRLVELEPKFDNPDCHELYAQALIMSGETRAEQASEQMDKAIAYNADDPSFKIKKMVTSHWGGEDMSECLEALYKFVETEEPNSLMYFQIGQFEMTKGNYGKGVAALEKSIELSTSMHEIESRVGSKLEMEFHMKMNYKLKAAGLDSLTEEMSRLALKTFQ